MAKDGLPDGMRSIVGWTLGVGIIAFVLLILVIIFGNLAGNVGFTQDSLANAEEEITLQNATAVTFADTVGRVNPTVSAVVVINATGGETILAGNYTLTATTIIGTQDMTIAYNDTGVNVSYTTSFDSQGQIDSDNIILNYTLSATNTAAQFPTVGTIVGIALLLLILIALLIFAIRKMMGVASESGGNTNASFG